jgi:hypothetical protein
MSAESIAAAERANARSRKAAARLFKAAHELSAGVSLKEQAVVVFNAMATLAAFAVALITEGLEPSNRSSKPALRAAALRSVKRLSREYAAEVRKLLPPKGEPHAEEDEEEDDDEEGD